MVPLAELCDRDGWSGAADKLGTDKIIPFEELDENIRGAICLEGLGGVGTGVGLQRLIELFIFAEEACLYVSR
jgi:hypothetical protein